MGTKVKMKIYPDVRLVQDAYNTEYPYECYAVYEFDDCRAKIEKFLFKAKSILEAMNKFYPYLAENDEDGSGPDGCPDTVEFYMPSIEEIRQKDKSLKLN